METNMLIGGSFEAGTDTEEKVLNPRNGELILNLAEANVEQINRAVASARSAFIVWSRTTPSERSAKLLAIADAIEANLEELAQLEALNCGKPINEVRNEEVPAVAD
jgi:aminobutyraldehyde dehydrogenase